jgi:arabinose-5-phosphate isomerase
MSLDLQSIHSIALEVFENEVQSLKDCQSSLDSQFSLAVECIQNCKGRVIITGIGKSAIIAQKIVATMNSTGTPSIFMHAADAIHGDLGIIQNEDVIIVISNSGNTPEIKVLIPFLKQGGHQLIAIVGDISSYLASQADFILNSNVKQEACPHNLAPTSSTTVQLVIGDALAVSLLKIKGFKKEDFAKFHPGGALGKRLFLKVDDLMVNHQKPFVFENDDLDKIIIEMTSKRLGATVVLNKENGLVGIITDGDLRRLLQLKKDLTKIKAIDFMGKNPTIIETGSLATEAFNLMKEKKITQLIVVDKNKYLGMIHIHDLSKEGIIN